MQEITVSDVAKILGKTDKTIRLGLQQNVFPWGAAVQTSQSGFSYVIYPKMFKDMVGDINRDERTER